MLDGGRREAIRAADEAREMVATAGWDALTKWISEEIRKDVDVIEKGARSWDEYQQAVGRIKSLRRVLERPADLAARVNTGDTYE